MMVKELRETHTGGSGLQYGAGKLDGVAILVAFEAARAQGDESRQDKCAERKLKGIEGRLPNNVTETQFSKHCNDFITYAVPYLEREMKPKLQVQWILDALPENCAGGAVLRINVPGVGLRDVVVPEGAAPGQNVEYQVPKATKTLVRVVVT